MVILLYFIKHPMSVGSPLLSPSHRKDSILSSGVRSSIFSLREKPLSLWSLVAIVFFTVCGGPFGSEPAMGAAGPFWALVGFVLFPVFWSIPEALITAELGSKFPSNTGFVSWCTSAFGPFIGYLQGWLSLTNSFSNCAVFTRLFASYVCVMLPFIERNVVIHVAFILAFALANCYINYRGLEVVGKLGVVLMWVICIPFLIVFLLAFMSPTSNWSNVWLEAENPPWSKSGSLALLLNTLFWNLNHWANVSTLTGEVKDVKKVLPRSLALGMAITVSMYVLTLSACAAVGDSPDRPFSIWKEGEYAVVAGQLGGPVLAGLMFLATAVSQVGQLQAQLSEGAYQLQAMADAGWFPLVLTGSSEYGTPTYPILMQFAGMLIMTQFDFLRILEAANAVYCVGQLLVFAAFIWLRKHHTQVDHSNFVIPLSTGQCAAGMVPGVLLLVAILLCPALDGNFHAVSFLGLNVVIATVSYGVMDFLRIKGLVNFARSPPRNLDEVLDYHFELEF